MIHVIGMGPGDAIYLTEDAKSTIMAMPQLIGVERQLHTVSAFLPDKTVTYAYRGKLDDLKALIEPHDYVSNDIGVLASGDPSFYGITEWLKRTFGSENIQIHPGISSTQILFAKVKVPMHDFYMTSLHGRNEALDILNTYEKLCLLTDKTYTPYFIARHFVNQGLDPRMVIGENLSYEDEVIEDLKASEVKDRDYKMSVVIVIHER